VAAAAAIAANPAAISSTVKKPADDMEFDGATVRLISSTQVLPLFVEDNGIVLWRTMTSYCGGQRHCTVEHCFASL